MSIALEALVKQLNDSGVLAPGTLDKFVPPQSHPKDAEELAKQLVKENHLTKFQATNILAGKTKALFLGNYTILDKLGEGGMGQVFKAQHRRMKRIVALKTLPPAVTKDAAAVARFQREAEAAAKLEHPNIVTAYDADQEGNVHFLVMQFVEGSDLSALVKKNGPFSVAKAVDYILQAARGLEFAHSQGVVHRDIKPANLLLDAKGTVRILDMGLARIESPGEAQAELTGSGAVMGTVDYMSPEQAFNTKNADARADIYSLGCSLHYLLTGKATYAGDTVVEKILGHREKPIPSLIEVQAAVPPELQAIFEKLVAKRVEDRYQSMTDAIADLESIRANLSASTSGISRSFTSAALPSVTIAGGASIRELKNELKPAKQPAPAQAGNGQKKLLIGAVSVAVVGLGALVTVIVMNRSGDQQVKSVTHASQSSTSPGLASPGANEKTVSTSGPSSSEMFRSSASAPRWPFDPPDGREYVWSEPENLGPTINTGETENV